MSHFTAQNSPKENINTSIKRYLYKDIHYPNVIKKNWKQSRSTSIECRLNKYNSTL